MTGRRRLHKVGTKASSDISGISYDGADSVVIVSQTNSQKEFTTVSA